MDINTVRDYFLHKPGAREDLPFGEDTLVFKVGGKMFGLMGLDNYPPTINLKCDPERAVDLRERYEEITPGYHMNKKHWNTVVLNGDLPVLLIYELIDHSYDLVVASLKKGEREALGIS